MQDPFDLLKEHVQNTLEDIIKLNGRRKILFATTNQQQEYTKT